MEYERLVAILHGQRLNEPLTWVYICALIAVAVAGWMFGGVLFDGAHKVGEEQ